MVASVIHPKNMINGIISLAMHSCCNCWCFLLCFVFLLQVGGELTDFIIVLRTKEAVKTFGSNVHLSVGAGLSAAVGIVGRAAEADLRAGDGGYAACYTYSCSKGAFVGCSLEGSMVTTRTLENSRFYGNSSISASDILLGSMPRPPAAAILYHALADLYRKLEG
ncbi:LAS seventeen-binding protein 3-like [Macadamia integrifolia]|uniref:LAS seventeen-binding protein 3-like n=1 Tax=Macadamia integrifolia TaxID=60698 RepID=UPI001C531EA6|nr:LAS seventeen-binding protein 3-like [Macadamia integrifolia]